MEILGLAFSQSDAEKAADKRFGHWFQRKLHLSTAEVVSAGFATFDWLSDGGLAYETWANAGGSYTPTASEQLACEGFLFEQGSVLARGADNATELVWDGGSIAVDPETSLSAVCGSSCSAVRAECSREREIPTPWWVLLCLVGGCTVGMVSDCVRTALQVRRGASRARRTATTEEGVEATLNPAGTAAAPTGGEVGSAVPAMGDFERSLTKGDEDRTARLHARIGGIAMVLEDGP